MASTNDTTKLPEEEIERLTKDEFFANEIRDRLKKRLEFVSTLKSTVKTFNEIMKRWHPTSESTPDTANPPAPPLPTVVSDDEDNFVSGGEDDADEETTLTNSLQKAELERAKALLSQSMRERPSWMDDEPFVPPNERNEIMQQLNGLHESTRTNKAENTPPTPSSDPSGADNTMVCTEALLRIGRKESEDESKIIVSLDDPFCGKCLLWADGDIEAERTKVVEETHAVKCLNLVNNQAIE